MILRVIGFVVAVALVAGGVIYVERIVTRPAAPPPSAAVQHQSRPTIHIDQVRELAALVTMHVPLSDVHASEVSGFTGGLRMVVAVHGDVEVGTDLGAARFTEVDDQQRTAVIALPPPRTMRPRIDHDRTRIVAIERRGMWQVLLGQAGESQLTNRAMAAAQQALAAAADDPQITLKACGHTERVIGQFFAALGWEVTVQWDPELVDDEKTRLSDRGS